MIHSLVGPPLPLMCNEQVASHTVNKLLFVRNYRFACYKVSSKLIEGKLGKGRRRQLPACLGMLCYCLMCLILTFVSVNAIRKKFPSSDGNYTGFKC